MHWETFSWEAFATLITGVAAVGAAFVVGLRQVAVANRQTEILQRQVGLDALKLRSELFERRVAVYDATRALLIAVVAKANEPPNQIQRSFLVALDQSKFLFAPAVHDRLWAIWLDCTHYFAAVAAATASYEANRTYGTADQISARNALLVSINERLIGLSEVFGDELKLGSDGQR